ncbi:MAG: hypothetical protein NC201_02740 [Prevotella sp.]|nr:hypothetical protein [Bacteroides sp.]MCM1366142.1 hypothetical protein [Prevotella sp.]MCM1436793.1 hypothetical protein [Prevotella sp.]
MTLAEFLFILLAIALIMVAATLQARNKQKLYNNLEDNNENQSNIDQNTQEILGHSAYVTMTERVAEIMRRHSKDRCIAVSLTSGVADGKGADELHHLLPGDPLYIKPAQDDGIDAVGVYSGGYKIGDLLLLDAEAVLEVLRTSTITGTYVCEQNCYEYYDKVALKIILFFTTADKPVRTPPENQINYANPDPAQPSPYKITFNSSPIPITLFQN